MVAGRWIYRNEQTVWKYLLCTWFFTKGHLPAGLTCWSQSPGKAINPSSTSQPVSPAPLGLARQAPESCSQDVDWSCVSPTILISAGCYDCHTPCLPKPEMETMFTIWHRSLENQPDTWWQLDFTGPLQVKGQPFVPTRIDLLWIWICFLWPWCFCWTLISEATKCLCYYHGIGSIDQCISQRNVFFSSRSKAQPCALGIHYSYYFPNYAETDDLLENCSGLLKTHLWHQLRDTTVHCWEAIL